MPRLPFWRRGRLDDFADAIHDELTEMPVPPADERLLARVLESRRGGTRVILPTADAARPRRLALYMSAVAAAAVVVMVATRYARRETALLDVARDSWLIGDIAYAQTTPPVRPAFAPAVASRPDRLRPQTLRYERRFVSAAGISTETDLRIELRRDSIAGARAWRVSAVTKTHDGVVDAESVWLDEKDLRPLRRVAEETPYRSYERIRIEQRLDGAHFTGEMRAWKAGALSAHRTFDRQLPSQFGPYISDAVAPLYHMAVPLRAGWSGSLSVLGWAVRDNDVFVSVDMRVDGEETVVVPAGKFACWRLAMHWGRGRRSWYWVRKSDGIGVRTLDSSAVDGGVRELALRGR
ncbi:MAG TPA: DUF3108 domain-containing protein [Gemmatimonadaceae bacterium]|nr:DUF3108 domain-containing protein [Gemmatimonadaceae bacterium]